MRRRKLFTFAAGASAVVFVGVCVLWVRSYRTAAGREDHFSWRMGARRVRYTVRSQGGRLVLFAPPASDDSAAAAAPWRSGVFPPAETPDALAGRLNNAQIRWALKRPLNWHPPEWPAGQTTGPADFSPFPFSNTPAHIVLARYGQS